MRLLFSCTAADGHFLPLVPLAHAARAAGHEVAVATAASYRDRVAAEELEHVPAGLDVAELERRFAPLREELRTSRLSFDERRVLAFARRFADLDAPAKLDDLLPAARSWRPHAIVHESGDLAAPVVAAALGVPAFHHSFGRAIPTAALSRAAERVAPLWRRCGLAPDELAGAYTGVYVDICPPSLQTSPPPPAPRLQRLRGTTARPPDRRAGRPLVYVTLGTIFNRAERFAEVLHAFDGLDCDVLATVGRTVDPTTIGPLPANARVERYVPQGEILPAASAAVGHGGSGSTFGALAHGLPLLLLPEGADQFDNALACAGAGAAIVLLPGDVNDGALRSALEQLIAEPGFAAAAGRVAAEIAELPGPAEAAAALFGP